MRNSFRGTCFVCNTPVDVGEGHFTRRGGKWKVKHWWHAKKVEFSQAAKKAEAEHNKRYKTQTKNLSII